MAKKDQSTEEPQADDAQAPGDGQISIRWDGSEMRSSYANACNVAGGREEIVLLFGMNKAWHAGQQEITVQLSDRIILNPFAAKRLCNMLNNVLRDYEAKFGALEGEIPTPDSATLQ